MYSQFKDVIYTPEYTPAIQRDHHEKMNAAYKKNMDIVVKMNEQQNLLNKANK
ncbi:hypothetical protein D3C84_1305410 [compost metagenome]